MKIKRIKVENVIVPREYHHDELAIRAYEHGFEHGYNRAHIIKLTHDSAECLIPAEFCGRGCARAGAAWVAGQAAGYEYYFHNDEQQRRHADAVLDLCDAIDPLPTQKPDDGNAIIPALILFMMLASLVAGILTVSGCAAAQGSVLPNPKDSLWKSKAEPKRIGCESKSPLVKKAVARDDYVAEPFEKHDPAEPRWAYPQHQSSEVQPKGTPRPQSFLNAAEAQTADHYFTDH